ncbi:C5-sterol desaturase [Imleria badia]|nr:C5-sterol desaturase [Imleria badia]
MDLALRIADEYVLDSVWAGLVPMNDPLANTPCQHILATNASTMALQPQSAWPRDYIPRQLLSLAVVTLIGINLIYLTFASLSFHFIFNHDLMRHPRFFKNQIRFEIQTSLKTIPATTLLMLPWFQAEVMGYSRLYDDVSEYGWLYFAFSIPLFLVLNDFSIYWIHRALHHPILYKTFHKHHHKLIVPTPFASLATHPVEACLLALSYYLLIFLVPLHRGLYLGLFLFGNVWGVIIHDSDFITGRPLEHIINGPSQHTLHHLHFTVNYGQYFTLADRVGGSYRHPEAHLDPLLDVSKEKTL